MSFPRIAWFVLASLAMFAGLGAAIHHDEREAARDRARLQAVELARELARRSALPGGVPDRDVSRLAEATGATITIERAPQAEWPPAGDVTGRLGERSVDVELRASEAVLVRVRAFPVPAPARPPWLAPAVAMGLSGLLALGVWLAFPRPAAWLNVLSLVVSGAAFALHGHLIAPAQRSACTFDPVVRRVDALKWSEVALAMTQPLPEVRFLLDDRAPWFVGLGVLLHLASVAGLWTRLGRGLERAPCRSGLVALAVFGNAVAAWRGAMPIVTALALVLAGSALPQRLTDAHRLARRRLRVDARVAVMTLLLALMVAFPGRSPVPLTDARSWPACAPGAIAGLSLAYAKRRGLSGAWLAWSTLLALVPVLRGWEPYVPAIIGVRTFARVLLLASVALSRSPRVIEEAAIVQGLGAIRRFAWSLRWAARDLGAIAVFAAASTWFELRFEPQPGRSVAFVAMIGLAWSVPRCVRLALEAPCAGGDQARWYSQA